MSSKIALKKVVVCGIRKVVGIYDNVRQASMDCLEHDINKNTIDLADFGYRSCYDEEEDVLSQERAEDKALEYYQKNLEEVSKYETRVGVYFVYESKKGNYFVSSSRDNKDIHPIKAKNGIIELRVSSLERDYTTKIKM